MELLKVLQKHSKEYQVIVLEVDDTEKMSKKLSAQAAEGWHVVSHLKE
jgi:hypothetical protein